MIFSQKKGGCLKKPVMVEALEGGERQDGCDEIQWSSIAKRMQDFEVQDCDGRKSRVGRGYSYPENLETN